MNPVNPQTEGKDPALLKRYSRYYTYIEPVFTDPVIRGYFTLIASILLIAFFIVFALSPTSSTILGLTRKIDDQRKLTTALDAKISSLIIAQENYSQAESSLPNLHTALPIKPYPDEILTHLLTTASASGIALTSVQISGIDLENEPPEKSAEVNLPASPPPAADISPLSLIPSFLFHAEAKGTRAQVRAFIGQLELLPRLIRLSTVNYNIDLLSSNQNLVLAEVTGLAFYYDDWQATPSTEAGTIN
ncbi:MAG: hypothetical protein UY21_C0002G0017 [Microgenomates group bacterium GW2011_GWA1_48_10]|uniref:Type 4a pilus biogenesis protein PilO n=1 Tax=Candidatus Gottesmanbacteria bacterium RIFCSPHIGHO2_01_FULL_47_48 TaxID=1798381 RepID=A0A1F6A0A5_9BACT|nr:MAG: hypothetical protein UY21_C0002G0017 [Microgenomates group bacterium GW2011_GWA1_48_10]OGG17812.1 MAG: hypothetical protein A2721_02205 [Candidatus Gottesmanbacteria bacterium RIFCSPHIGHO2_01_FULL_47_48]